ncbi:autotransporter domain-containing protein [Bosea sp. ASV33]|uniref:autotransporter domain-containing protein n=1 Tax=Bosea sp. ASV33 TaxID=2795106 RepID=UPI0018EB83DF|nr:autotransporter domain-containing protein [Bosea sp. ASV33]
MLISVVGGTKRRLFVSPAVSALAFALAFPAVAADVNVTSNVTTGINLDTFVGATVEIAPGVSVSNVLLSGAIGATTSAWALTNRGSISSTSATSVTLPVAGSSVVNFGSITAMSANGIILAGGGSVDNRAGATISSGLSAIAIGTATAGAGSVINAGTIIQTGVGGDLVTLRFGGTVTNLQGATISASNSGNAVSVGQGTSRTVFNAGAITNTGGNFSTGVLVQGGPSTVTNTATGRISGAFNGIYASASAGLTLTNDGLIESTGASGARRAVEATGGGSVVNNGTIRSLASDGLYYARAGSVINRGTISGAVNAINFSGNYARSLTLDTGSVLNGNVQGGTGVDALVLTGNGSQDIGKVLAFEALTMQGTSWQLPGNGSFATSATVQSGALSVGGTLTAPTVNVQSNGTLTGTGTIAGPVTVSGALLGTSGQTLTLASLALDPTARLNVTLGSASPQTLFAVNGALVLDGTLNITAASGFGPGIYRILSYGGAFTDNGLDIGSVPAGTTPAAYTVQTSVAGQVNLLSTATLPAGPFQFWDGGGIANDGVIAGGSGVWSATTPNWTNAAGMGNQPMSPQPGFAIFQGQPGIVTVDRGAGAVGVSGIQFASNGYTVLGDPITLASPQTVVRVGDGTFAGSGFTATIASPLVGAGGLTKTDLGQLVLAGNNSYAGATTVEGGSLIVNGSIDSPVTVASGALLGGSGSIGSVLVNGVLAPGNSLGTLTVNGNLSFGANGIYAAEVQGAASDKVVASGSASLAGTLRLVPLGGSYIFSSPYTLLSAAGGLAGTRFGTVDTSGSFGDGVTTAVNYTATDVLLTLTPKPFGLGVTSPRNAAAVARALDGAVAAGGDVSPLFAIYNLPAAAIPGAVNQLSGEVHAAAPAMANEAAGGFLTTMLDAGGTGRLNGSPSAPGGAAGFTGGLPSKTDGPGKPSFDPAFFAMWGASFGSTGRTDGDKGIGSNRRTLSDGHLAVGADIRLGAGTVAGVAISGGRTSAALASATGNADADVFQLGIYGRTSLGPLKLAGALGYARLDVNTSRAIPALARTGITASYHTQAWSGRAEASLPIGTSMAGSGRRITIAPLVAFQAVQATSPAAMERDGGGIAAGTLALASHTDTTSRSEIGVQLEGDVPVGGTPITGFVRAAWAHYFLRGATISATLNGLTNASFVAEGARTAPDAALIAAGMDIKLSPSVSLGARIEGEFAGNAQRFAGHVRYNLRF